MDMDMAARFMYVRTDRWDTVTVTVKIPAPGPAAWDGMRSEAAVLVLLKADGA